MSEKFDLFARIPVYFKHGAWTLPSGRPLLAMPGTEAELFISRDALHLLDEGIYETSIRMVLGANAKLLVALTVVNVDQISADLMDRLVAPQTLHKKVKWHFVTTRISTSNRFFEIVLGEPKRQQKLDFPDFPGGLMLTKIGSTISEISPSTIHGLEEIAPKAPLSLNHALTMLSELYEVHRASHTGNIFQRIFYQEKDRNWYPLEFLRHGYLDGPKVSHARDLWESPQ